ncbi:MAG: Holliday junction branch migration protein RuvA [Pseudomonadota bacterium]
MIGRLRGRLDAVDGDQVLIDVGGVGYEVTVPIRQIASLAPGAPLTLVIETQMRENELRLFGFPTTEERAWFRLLQSVQGVGARVALAILDQSDGASLHQAIAMQDAATLQRAQGVGAKLAKRIVTELKDKAPALSIGARVADRQGSEGHSNPSAGPPPGPLNDAVSALVNLGLDAPAAHTAVLAALAEVGDEADIDTVIKAALRGHGAALDRAGGAVAREVSHG